MISKCFIFTYLLLTYFQSWSGLKAKFCLVNWKYVSSFLQNVTAGKSKMFWFEKVWEQPSVYTI